MKKQLMKGNDAVIYGAILGGATHFFGYPITPASEIAHAAAKLFTETGRSFLQVEDEVNTINMIYGASGAGARAMTASSGPGISLMAEGLSYIAGAELPCVIVNVQRAGPGLGNIWPEQGDYNSVVKGGGHGNYRNIVLAPSSTQEMCDFTYKAFELAEQYRSVVFILSDAYIGQMMEPVALPTRPLNGKRQDWALYGDEKSRNNLITSIYMSKEGQQDHNIKLQQKYALMEDEICDWEEFSTDDADILFVAFGIGARLSLTALRELRKTGKKVGLLRPKTLFPFPKKRLFELKESVKNIIVLELNNGQMVDDVELATEHQVPVIRFNWMGGMVPTTKEVVDKTIEVMGGKSG